ncbi:hypothetical protein [Nocardia sp. NPDC051463]|uniref:hypothetical protein n=1 Tax=Nocardia sp. NPDC051463 TaxID=3154845 RepID=UPI00344E7A88
MSRLVCYVYVADDGGSVHAYGPDDHVPAWAREKITNPNVWDSQTVAVVIGAGGGGGTLDATVSGGGPDGGKSDGPPPQGGAGASRQKWADYATLKGVTVKESWKREDIIAACEKAGVPV